jgi:uncharacterized protein YoaH (UPF0181 family)
LIALGRVYTKGQQQVARSVEKASQTSANGISRYGIAQRMVAATTFQEDRVEDFVFSFLALDG